MDLLSQHKLNLAARLGFEVCCLFIDINNFKPLNDNFGHEVGDQALISLADSMKGTLREADIIGRLGGDEFVALLQATSGDCIDTIMKKLETKFKANLQSQGLPELSLSIGYAMLTQHNETFADLLKRADEDMYEKKQAYKRD